MDLAVAALAFGAIFVVELPDKTFIATLVLSTKFRPLLVWIGVGLAFFAQTMIAVLLGKAAALLPSDWVHLGAAVMFLAGAALLYREALRARSSGGTDDSDSEDEFATKAGTAPKQGVAAVGASFLILFAAEWGDLSQLLTLSLVAKYNDPVSVFIGAWCALLTVSGLAVLLGRVLMRYISLKALHLLGGTVCLLLAGLTIYELIG